ncbi:uncharacterized protein DUF4314 [Ruminiclostridium sufflavum DSM 19573]|uniref:Uncharacterized protein DUF4314 n=1 Tax=Ruminiclostridium sufflavum DSM 19573 TaxID=1121337 RepID=A0A318XS68_9FIRM|nr:DUF4314 domain-containing protein [Ruminiclostridium sufflavum]PYG84794.1 uncharacterized protein DUF4314 [Ruminiclostridium sufflavum DSM 19573]
MNRISKEHLSNLRKKFLPGTRVELVRMNDPYTKLEEGTTGTVVMVDDIGTIHVKWDCGSCLGIVYGEDSCTII